MGIFLSKDGVSSTQFLVTMKFKVNISYLHVKLTTAGTYFLPNLCEIWSVVTPV